MKRYILICFTLLFSLLIFAADNYTLLISGNVFEEHSHVPLGDREVFISIDKTNVFPGYYAELHTNNDGFVFDAIEIPKEVKVGVVFIEIEDCNGVLVGFEKIFSENDSHVHFSIPVCDESALICQADFTYQSVITNCFKSYSYFFTDQSHGEGDLFFWDFGDGTSSDEKNILHTFKSSGTFKVCHSIARNDGTCYDTVCQEIVIDSVMNHDCGVTFEPVYFSGLTAGFQAYTESPYPTVFEWDFGDGSTGMGDFVIHTFPKEGSYTVTVSSEDSYFCTDSYQDEVIVSDTLEPCEAWYAIMSDSTNPFRYSFFDMSNGDIAFWHWDFGDGSSSEEQNPSHEYSLNGLYNVTLSVEDTANNCTSSVTRIVEVDYHPDCKAEFSYLLDSLSSRRNHFYFTNNSTIQFPGETTWSFGDGEEVINWETNHVYDVGGTYDVCLNIKDQFGYCDVTVCTTIETPVYRNIGGYLFKDDFPINNPIHEGDTAIAYIYRKHSTGLYLVDTMAFFEYGYYYFTWLLEGEYIIKANLKNNSSHYGLYFPVYHPSTLKWQDADFIDVHSDIFDCNTVLVDQENMGVGSGSIHGRIIFKTPGTRNYDPVNILLYNEDEDALMYEVTDEFGFFRFENIALQCYYVVAESTGDFSLPSNICLTESVPAVEDVEIEIFDTDVTGIDNYNEKMFSKIFLFPVPTQATLNISFESKGNNRAIIRVLNYSGQIVYEENYTVKRGLNGHSIPVEDLPSGIYVLKIITPAGSETFVSKFIRD